LLQCVAVCCSVLQCVAVCCSVLHCVAVYAQRVALRCNLLRYVGVLICHTAVPWECGAVWCSVL